MGPWDDGINGGVAGRAPSAGGAGPLGATALFSLFSLAQFLTAPLWGRLSDKIGRKPVILISFAGSALGYLWLAFATDLQTIYLARIFSGAMNGWLATSQAYVADVTDDEGRAKGMGMLGAAFGLGFIFGPALGGYLAGEAVINYQLPMLIAAGGSAIALLVSAFLLREPKRQASQGVSTMRFLPLIISTPILFTLIMLYFGMTLHPSEGFSHRRDLLLPLDMFSDEAVADLCRRSMARPFSTRSGLAQAQGTC